MRTRVLLAVLALALSGLPGGAHAEVRRMEAVGAVPVDPEARRGSAPRDAAIEEALRESVSRVASELLIDSDGLEDSDLSLEEILGSDMIPYTHRFRILEDRGPRRALFADQPGVTTEYVVVVEVHVDVERVKARLTETGLLHAEGARRTQRRVRVEVEGLSDYGAYEALRRSLIEVAGAQSVVPVEFERGRAVLMVESEDRAPDLFDRLQAHTPANLQVFLVRARSDALQLRLEWTPPEPGVPAGPGASPTPGGSRSRRD
ncbi:MAG: hypothetical protein O7G30_12665 [Proteobacteria bacterium]|nr:hypothetical protein [Pseudomonadota bacterium]